MLVCFWTSSSKRKVTIDDLRTYYESANERTVNISRRCGLGWGVRLVPGCLDLMLNLGLRFFIPTSSPNKLSFSKEGGSCSYGFSFFFFFLPVFFFPCVRTVHTAGLFSGGLGGDTHERGNPQKNDRLNTHRHIRLLATPGARGGGINWNSAFCFHKTNEHPEVACDRIEVANA